MQSISCNGNAHSFLNHSELFALLEKFEIIYHPILESIYTLKDVYSTTLDCDILILEGAFREEGFKKFNKEVYLVAKEYAKRAKYIISAGTCATFGGVFKEQDREAISGFLYKDTKERDEIKKYKDKLISLPGCPIHPIWLGYILEMIYFNKKIPLDELLRPTEIFASTIHQGCSRNEYFEWKVDAKGFGYKEGCLFYEHGCQGPYTRGSCNKIPWNEVGSKTEVGTPCFGCTEPTFPTTNLYKTKTNMGIPQNVPLGVSKRAYLTLTGIAKSFKIDRLEKRAINYEDS